MTSDTVSPITRLVPELCMAVRRSRPGSAKPFVTRRSTLAFSAVCVLTSAGFQAVGATSGPGVTNLFVAVLVAVALVSGGVAWISGVVLAVRAGSLLWTVIAAFPIPPLNAVLCAVFCPAGPAEQG